MKSIPLSICLISAAFLASGACRDVRQKFLRSGYSYKGIIRIDKRPILLPELKQVFGRLDDTTQLLLHVDSVTDDSIFGTFSADFRRLGLGIGAYRSEPQFKGHRSGDSVSIRLVSNATDVGAVLHGKISQNLIKGKWQAVTGEADGTFVLQLQK